jgi:hypothetical protein
MVEVYKTNVQKKKEATALIKTLSEKFPKCIINFDMEDCDKILRVEGSEMRSDSIIHLLKSNGFHCEVLN